ncbi:DUF7079 family protein [Costertonia aggregata]|uniref:DUF7079 domain-containing protein n=1 Tax=Costertonia aggregata TaxID=343403 RepID=A0A7H9ARM6_9FLAO|nr:hypothetical protein [Costertonia aggregata]QLG46141.1 hypothetical protein HYG79_12540 [Costertonia aggregata]
MSPKEIEQRKPIWIAISDFYLDTELDDVSFKYIAKKIHESTFTFEEVKQIDRTDVFPVLYGNLLTVAGIWSGFNEEWLVPTIIENLSKQNTLSRFFLKIKYRLFRWMYKEYWEKLEYFHKTFKHQ